MEDNEIIKTLFDAYVTICDPKLVYGSERELSPMPNKLFSPEERAALEILSHDPELLYRFCKKMQVLAILTNTMVANGEVPGLDPIFE